MWNSCTVPDPPPLPRCCLGDGPLLVVTGVDFRDSLFVGQKIGHKKKVCIYLFTYALTRAVHLEVLTDISGEAFVQAFQQF